MQQQRLKEFYFLYTNKQKKEKSERKAALQELKLQTKQGRETERQGI